MHTLSLSLSQTPITKRLDSQDAAALKKLKALYDDSQKNGKRAAGDGVEKRGFWHWVKMTFESPGLGSGS